MFSRLVHVVCIRISFPCKSEQCPITDMHDALLSIYLLANLVFFYIVATINNVGVHAVRIIAIQLFDPSVLWARHSKAAFHAVIMFNF